MEFVINVRVLKLLFGFLFLIGSHFSLAGNPPLPDPGPISKNSLPVCYDFDCNTIERIKLSSEDWAEATSWFILRPANNPKEERHHISQFIGLMEKIVGSYTPTYQDLAMDRLPKEAYDTNQTSHFKKKKISGQMDCVDDAVNLISYLKLLERDGLLKYHKVVEFAYRRGIIFQHWAGQIEEKRSGRRFVVDSWFYANGHKPIIQDSESWHASAPITPPIATERLDM